jgi:hypothetical protein
VVTFNVSAEGGVLRGVAEVDHTSVSVVVFPFGGLLECPTWPGYAGAPWVDSVNETLAPGEYVCGAICGGFANITVTQPIELLYP